MKHIWPMNISKDFIGNLRNAKQNEILFHPLDSQDFKSDSSKCWQESGWTETFYTLLAKTEVVQPLWRKTRSLVKKEHPFSLGLISSTLRQHHWENLTGRSWNTYKNVHSFISHLKKKKAGKQAKRQQESGKVNCGLLTSQYQTAEKAMSRSHEEVEATRKQKSWGWVENRE